MLRTIFDESRIREDGVISVKTFKNLYMKYTTIHNQDGTLHDYQAFCMKNGVSEQVYFMTHHLGHKDFLEWFGAEEPQQDGDTDDEPHEFPVGGGDISLHNQGRRRAFFRHRRRC